MEDVFNGDFEPGPTDDWAQGVPEPEWVFGAFMIILIVSVSVVSIINGRFTHAPAMPMAVPYGFCMPGTTTAIRWLFLQALASSAFLKRRQNTVVG